MSRYTVADYMGWSDDERWELIEGLAYNMSPAPTIKHQSLAGRFYTRLEQRLQRKPCRPFIAPTDVVLSDEDIVQPDVLVVCDSSKITENNIQGAPDLVVEIWSPGTAVKDMREKKALYQRTGVREYIVVGPQENYVQRFFLNHEGIYGAADVFGAQENLPLLSLPDVVILLWEVFELDAPEEE